MGLLNTDIAKRALNAKPVVALLKAIIPPADKFLLRLTRGWVSTAMQSIVLLQTTGAKSGQPREIVTLCMPDEDALLLVGSNWGGDTDPAWVHNLRATPTAHATYRGYRGTVQAFELAGNERTQVWEALVAFNPQYARYQALTERQLPIIRLVKCH